MPRHARRSLVPWMLAVGLLAAVPARATPRVHHLLIEVQNLDRSVAFYRDLLGFKLGGRHGDFATLEADNVGIYLWQQRWSWEGARRAGERSGLGLYPHLEVADVRERLERLRHAGVRVVEEAKDHDWGTEAFVADPDGYVWALVKMAPPAGAGRQ